MAVACAALAHPQVAAAWGGGGGGSGGDLVLRIDFARPTFVPDEEAAVGWRGDAARLDVAVFGGAGKPTILIEAEREAYGEGL
jgi:hypothetical protein